MLLNDELLKKRLTRIHPHEYFRLQAMSVLYSGITSGNFVILKKAYCGLGGLKMGCQKNKYQETFKTT